MTKYFCKIHKYKSGDSMKKNILLIYIHTFLSTFILYYICDTLFYIERGLTSSQYISFVGIAFFIKLIFEIPFGVVADKYNKKNLLITSNLLFIASTVIFIFSHNYFTFLIAIIINAINNSLSSGIINSILYENTNDKKNFNKILFYNSFSYNISYMIAMIIGGIIGQKLGLVYAYYFTIIPFIIDFMVLFKIKIDKKIEKNNTEKNISVLKNGIKEIKNNSYLIKLMYKKAVLFSGIKLVEESHPQYSADIGISVFLIGMYTSLILIFCIVGSYLGSKSKKDKYSFILNINPIIVGIFILLTGVLNNYIGILFILLIYIFSESFDNIMVSELHNNISSKYRVTVESISQFVFAIFGILFSLTMTILLNFINLNIMYIILGIMIIILELFSILKKSNKGFVKWWNFYLIFNVIFFNIS